MRRLSDSDRPLWKQDHPRDAVKRRRRKLVGMPNLGFAKPSWPRLYRTPRAA